MRCLVAGAGSALGRQRAGAAADVEVEFIDVDGTPRRESLNGCWNVAFERVAAVRGFCVVPRAAQPAGSVVVRHYR